MKAVKRCVAAMFLIVVIASDVHTAEYADYEGVSSDSEGRGSRDVYDAVQQSDDFNAAKLWDIPTQHLMVRKSQRSPSLRLRFGRRSDPLLTNDLSDAFLGQDIGMERKAVRSPSYRLRFGRRSDPEISEDFMVRKSSRSPSFRLRFGRRSDPLITPDFTNSFLGDEYLDKKISRSPSYRLRFGRQSGSVGSSGALSGTSPDKGSPSEVEDN